MEGVFVLSAQKGPRAYVVFSHGAAVAVTDTGAQADRLIGSLKRRGLEGNKMRRGSRLAAEEWASWHNHEHPTNILVSHTTV